VAAIHDDTPEDDIVNVVLPSVEMDRSPIVDIQGDPFSKGLDKVKDFGGLSATTKRRISRNIQKYAGGTLAGEEKPLATGKGSAKSKNRIDKYTTGYAIFDVVEPDYNLDYLAKLYEISPAHKAAVDAKVTNIVGLGYSFIESAITQERMADIDSPDQLNRARKKITRSKNALDRWLDSLNSEESFIETLRKVVTDYETVGNGYFEIGRTVSGEIGYVGHLPATTIRRRVNKDGYIQIVAARATFFRNFGDRKTKNPVGDDNRPNEIIHISKYTPTNSYYGVPDSLAARNAIAGEEFASRFNLDYFEHKAVPRYIVVVKNAKLSAQAEKRLVDFLQTGLKGQHHRTIYVPLPADSEGRQVEFKLEPVESSITDASFTKYKELNRDEILTSHRVPLPQVGVHHGVSTGATRDSARMFKEQVCRPIQDIIEKRLQPFFSEKTNAFDFHLNELTLTDEETSSRINERMLRWDVITPNEVREKIGRSPIDEGDERVGIWSQTLAKSGGSGPRTQIDTANNSRQTRTRDNNESGGPNQAQSDQSSNLPGEGSRRSQ
jgi:PBSX family phage portal protein